MSGKHCSIPSSGHLEPPKHGGIALSHWGCVKEMNGREAGEGEGGREKR